MTRTTEVRKHRRVTPSGKKATVKKHPRKIKVPPAWTNVKFFKNKPYLARGKDEKGRFQYIYRPSFIKKQQEKKFKRVIKLESDIPKVLARMNADVNKGNQEAQVIYTMFKTGFRPGTSKDTRAEKKALGTITLRSKNVQVRPRSTVKFMFLGKKGVHITKTVRDKRLANIMKERKKNAKLFDTNEKKVREYFENKANGKYQLKDLRTLKAHKTARAVAKNGTTKEIGEAVAKELSNTPKVALSSYVAPSIIR